MKNRIRLETRKKRVYSSIPYIRAVSYGSAIANHKDYQTNHLDNSIMARTETEITAL